MLEVEAESLNITSLAAGSPPPPLEDTLVQEGSETHEELLEVRTFDLELEKLASGTGRTSRAGAWAAIGVLGGLVGWVLTRHRKG